MQNKSCYYAITLCALLSTIQNHGSIQQLLLITDTAGTITISAPGTYILGNNITGNIVIASSQVVLDLNGQTITGGSISITNAIPLTDIVIYNGTLLNTTGSNAISIFGAASPNRHRNITVSNIIIDNPAMVGVRFDECNNILISNVLVTGDQDRVGTGIQLTNVDFATIEGTRITQLTTGIDTNDGGCTQIFINNSIVYNCAGTGFDVGNLCQIVGCMSTGNATGFICQSGPGVIANCSALQNTGDGIQITTGNWEVLNCQANSNGANGIHAVTLPNVIIKLCQVAYNSGDGILLNTGTNGSVEGCSAIRNTGAGFNNIDNPCPVNYSANLASNNTPGGPGPNYVNVTTNVPVIYTTSTAYWRNIAQPMAP